MLAGHGGHGFSGSIQDLELLDDSDFSADEFLAEYRKNRKPQNTNTIICPPGEDPDNSDKKSKQTTKQKKSNHISQPTKPTDEPTRPKARKRRRRSKKTRDIYLRLSKPANRPLPPEPTKTTTKSSNIKRLYDMSIEKRPEAPVPAPEFINSPKAGAYSQKLAKDRMLARLNSECEDITGRIITSSELLSKLRQLGILGSGQSTKHVPSVSARLSSCAVEQDGEEPCYNGDLVKETLISAVTDSPSEFWHLIRSGILSKTTKASSHEETPAKQSDTVMSRDSLERLSRPKHKRKKKEMTRHRDPMIWGYKKPPPPPTMSEKTKRILKKMAHANLPFEERDRIFLLMKDEELKMLQREQRDKGRELAMTAHSVDRTPPFSPEMRQMLDLYWKRRDREEEPAWKSKNGADAARQVYESDRFPDGWENDVVRHRLAYIRRRERLEEDAEEEMRIRTIY